MTAIPDINSKQRPIPVRESASVRDICDKKYYYKIGLLGIYFMIRSIISSWGQPSWWLIFWQPLS